MPKKYTKAKPLNYEPTEEQITAYNWGVDNGYIISPLGISGKLDEYRIGIATSGNHKVVRKDPSVYKHDEVMEKVYEYYTYYYERYYKNI